MKSIFFESKLGILLRWLFFLPIAFILSLIGSLLGLLFELLRSFLGMSDGGEWSLMVAPIVGSYVFYSAINLLVPKFKITILYILFVFSILIRVLGVIWYDKGAENLLSVKGNIILIIWLIVQTLYQIIRYKLRNDNKLEC